MRCLLLIPLALCAASALAAGGLDALVSADPAKEADAAFASGDRRALVIPICNGHDADVLPGWPNKVTPAHLEAIKSGSHPLTCNDIRDEVDLARAVKYAEVYNRTMLGLVQATKQ